MQPLLHTRLLHVHLLVSLRKFINFQPPIPADAALLVAAGRLSRSKILVCVVVSNRLVIDISFNSPLLEAKFNRLPTPGFVSKSKETTQSHSQSSRMNHLFCASHKELPGNYVWKPSNDVARGLICRM